MISSSLHSFFRIITTYFHSLVPCSLNDGDGNTVVSFYSLTKKLFDCLGRYKILSTAKNHNFVESIMRVVATEMGSSAALCPSPLAMREARDFGVTRSLSQAWRIGRAIAICRQSKYVFFLQSILFLTAGVLFSDINGIVKAILEIQEGKCLFVGKIVDVSRVGFI